MFLDVAIIKTKKGVKNGLAYQMKNGRGQILYGFPETVKHWAANSNSENTKAYSILISFKESKEELEEKLSKQGYTLDELLMDIEELIFAGYSREELAYTMIAHSDTDNFHIHIYTANNYAATGKTLKLWFNKTDFAAIKQFIDLKYGLDGEPSTTKAGRIRKAGSLKWKGEDAKKREEAKDKIHEAIMKHVLQGNITDNQQVRERMELYTALAKGTIKEVEIIKTPDGTIKEIDKDVKVYGNNVLIKMYKNAISIGNLVLRGGIYKEDWTAQKNLKVKELLDDLIRYLERRLKETERYNKDRQKRKAEQPKYREEILGKNLLNFLKQLKQNQQQQQNQNQQNQQHQKPQPANQNQPARDNLQEQENLQEPRPRMRL
ncbi:MAG: relaxase/mobilization nuclease domain-containing protein [Sulfurihydrogenibium sp.]